MRKYFKSFLTLQRLRLLAIYALIFLLSGFLGNIWMTRNQQSGQVPTFVAKDLTGSDFRLEFNPPREKSTLIYFFAEWCPICKIQHSVISAIDENYDVIGIAMQSGDTANVRNYVASQNIEFKVINDEFGDISRSFGVNGVPATFIIDKTGSIKYSTRGYTTEAGILSRMWLAD